jgi:hypothetical protein
MPSDCIEVVDMLMMAGRPEVIRMLAKNGQCNETILFSDVVTKVNIVIISTMLADS